VREAESQPQGGARFAAAAPDAAMIEAGRRLFAQPIDFLRGVVAADGLPAADRIEVCFAGRSNVGKSSLLNALAGRRGLARTSSTPGRTQEINIFTLGAAHYLVDLPGYGYAAAPRPKVAAWQRLMRAYLSGRPNLRRAFVLVDARHGTKPIDEEMFALLDSAAVVFQVVLTKADKLPRAAREAAVARLAGDLAGHPAAFPEIVLTSAAKGEGLDTMRAAIAAIEV